MRKHNEMNVNNSETVKIIQAILIGCSFGIICCAVLLSICSMLFVKLGTLPTSYLPLITTFIGAVGAFFAGYFTVKMHKKNGMLMGMLSGLLLFAAVAISSLSKGMDFDIVSAIIKLLVFSVMGAIGGIIRVNKKVKVKRY